MPGGGDETTTEVNAESGIGFGPEGSMPFAAAAASVKVPAAMTAAVAISLERGARKGDRWRGGTCSNGDPAGVAVAPSRSRVGFQGRVIRDVIWELRDGKNDRLQSRNARGKMRRYGMPIRGQGTSRVEVLADEGTP